MENKALYTYVAYVKLIVTLYVIQDCNLYLKTYKMHIAYTCISQDTDRSVSQTSVRVHTAISRALSHDRGRIVRSRAVANC